MATLIDAGGDTFLHYPSSRISEKWTSAQGASLVTETLDGPFKNEPVMQIGGGLSTHIAFPPSETVYFSMKRVTTGTTAFNDHVLFHIGNINNLNILGGYIRGGGAISLGTGGVINAGPGSTPLAQASAILQANVYFLLEGALRAVAPPNASLEIRLNGVRVPSLSTDNFLASGVHPAGTIVQSSLNLSNISQLPNQIDVGSSFTQRMGWFFQSRGSGLWTSIGTGTTYALRSDFLGDGKRFWCPYDGADVAGFNFPTANWLLGGGAANVAAAIGKASATGDTGGYIVDAVAPVPAAADSCSFTIQDPPALATKILRAQHVIHARGSATGSPSRLKTGLYNGAGVATYDPAFLALVDGQYKFYIQPETNDPDGATWLPATLQALRGIINLETLTP